MEVSLSYCYEREVTLSDEKRTTINLITESYIDSYIFKEEAESFIFYRSYATNIEFEDSIKNIEDTGVLCGNIDSLIIPG